MNNAPLIELSKALAYFRKGMAELLSAPEHNVILLNMDGLAQQMENRLNHLAGIPVTQIETAAQFPPITEFMGEKITYPTKVDAKDLTPKQHEKAQYRNRVDKLELELPSLAPEGVLNSFTTPEDQLILRGVAKRAKLKDYQDGEINLRFIERILEGLKTKEADDRLQDEIDQNIQEATGNAPLLNDTEEHEITLEDLEKFPALDKHGFAAGQTIDIPAGTDWDSLEPEELDEILNAPASGTEGEEIAPGPASGEELTDGNQEDENQGNTELESKPADRPAKPATPPQQKPKQNNQRNRGGGSRKR